MRQTLLAIGTALAIATAAHAGTVCKMTFSLKGWSMFYKTASGSGTIRCDNGQKAAVKIAAKGGGLTAGNLDIENNYVRAPQRCLLDGLPTGRCLTYDNEVLLGLQDLPDPRPHQGMVVDEKNGDRVLLHTSGILRVRVHGIHPPEGLVYLRNQ